MIKISFVIVNYNTASITKNAIDSIERNKYLKKIRHEIILVDNASTDNSLSIFKDNYQDDKDIILIKNKKNYGFGYANNVGVKEARGKYICIINSDTLSLDTNYEELLCIIEENKDIILSCKILNSDLSIQSLGFDKPTLYNEFKLYILFWNFNFVKKIRYKNKKNIGMNKRSWVSGAFFIISRDNYEKLNGFDESIFMYAEDMDLCIRGEKVGIESYVYDQTSIIHLHGASSSNKKKYSVSSNLARLIKAKESYFYVIKKNEIMNPVETTMSKIFYLFHAIVLSIIKKVREKK